ncbi:MULTISPECIES: hypothetical protein [Vibrio]|uniref:hypothetical protein n=1 Tax=Vibrio TaxID=662 RepID=UPI00078B3749|nr:MULTISPECIES: hypothetical protein [Vibrio]BAU70765.1 hypothetical protein [Vibrio sp. 04Ya108]BCN24791.1 hypothetical protein VYA_19830 [Vibrio alfacsensis]BCN27148.1 hypothetical protein VYA_43400 [Vibrio alfacsensis]
MAIELLIRLTDEDLSHVTLIANKQGVSIEEALSLSLQNQVKAQIAKDEEVKKVDQSRLMNTALHNAFMLDEGTEFSLTELLGEAWAQVESPRAFGRSFRKELESLEIGLLSHKTVDNKAIYKRTDIGEKPD